MKKPSISSKKQQTSISIQKHKYYYLVIFFGVSLSLFLTSLTQVFSSYSSVSATSNNDGTVSSSSSVSASVTVGVGSCTFERDTVSDGNGTYTGTLANGATPIEVDGSIFEIKCNDGGGSAIYAIGYSNDQLTNTDLISSLGSDTNIHTGVYNSEDTTHDSSWAMKMKAKEGGYSGAIPSFGDFSTFQPIPGSYTMVASYPSSTLDPTGTVTSGGKIQAVYQAYASYTQPAGTYTGQVKYTMVHPNTADAPTPTIDDIQYLQDFANFSATDKTAIINSMTEEQTYTKKDKRDEQNYTIAKLKDGKVWMTKNLNIAGGTALSADNTDVDASYIESFTTSNNLTKTNNTIILPESSTSGFNVNNYSYIYNSGNITASQADCTSTQACNSYYSWDAATLGSGRSINTENTDAPYSICPKGWELPTSRTTAATNWQTESDFYALAHQYGLDSTTSTSENDNGFYKQAGPGTVPNFLLTGRYDNGSFYNGGGDGFYWSSTSPGHNSFARYLYFFSSHINSSYMNNRYYGFAVRCLAK